MKEYCENSLCENPAFKEAAVSVHSPSDQKRSLCATCEEVYTWGVQHGSMTAGFDRLNGFLQEGGFVVLAKNRQDPSQGAPLEAWAYRGPLDFASATPATFGLGEDIRDALSALNIRLGSSRQNGNEADVVPDNVGKPTALRVNERELATILAALRFHQDENLQAGAGIPGQAIRDIATDGGSLEPLRFEEVDELCERINLSEAGVGTATHPAIQRIHDLLYMDMKDGQESYNPDKNWDADVMAMIAEVVAEYIPRPQ